MEKTLTFIAPDGKEYTIREQNGHDEDIISNVQDSKDNTSISKFIASVIVNPILTWQYIQENMGVATKYYICFKSRILTHGSTLIFKHKFLDGTMVEYEEDLSSWDNNLSKPIPQDAKEGSIVLYPNGAELTRNLTTPSGKKVVYSILTSEGESQTIGTPQESRSINDEFRCRGLKQILGEREITIQNFRDFTASDMRFLRKDLEANDINFTLTVPLVNPNPKAEVHIENISLFTVKEFFFPL